MKTKIRIVIAEDQEIYRDGLLVTLNGDDGFEIVGEAENGKELLELVAAENPDIVLTDIMMPVMDGIEACKVIMQESPAMTVIAMTVFEEQSLIMEMIDAGATGYVMKNSGKEALLDAIQKTYKGESHFCKRTNRKLTEFWGARNARLKQPSFTQRELEVIGLICEGLSHEEIAGKLYISKKTVDSCSHRVLQKIEEKNAIGLVKYAIMNGIYKLSG